jgi:hypothetical protein
VLIFSTALGSDKQKPSKNVLSEKEVNTEANLYFHMILVGHD